MATIDYKGRYVSEHYPAYGWANIEEDTFRNGCVVLNSLLYRDGKFYVKTLDVEVGPTHGTCNIVIYKANGVLYLSMDTLTRALVAYMPEPSVLQSLRDARDGTSLQSRLKKAILSLDRDVSSDRLTEVICDNLGDLALIGLPEA